MTLGLKIGSDLQTKKCAIGQSRPIQSESFFILLKKKWKKKNWD